MGSTAITEALEIWLIDGRDLVAAAAQEVEGLHEIAKQLAQLAEALYSGKMPDASKDAHHA